MAKKDNPNAAIGSIYVGEHIKQEANYVADWIVGHLRNNTSPDEFKKFWEIYEETEELPTPALLRKRKLITTLSELTFEGLPSLDEFYKIAVNQKATEFITFNNNAYIDIVAIRGYPLGKDIATQVLGEKNTRTWTDKDTIEYIGKSYLNRE